MAPSQHHTTGASQQRRQDEGRKNDSTATDVEGDPLSDGHTDGNDADKESNDVNGTDTPSPQLAGANGQSNGRAGTKRTDSSRSDNSQILSDTEAKMNGLKASESGNLADHRRETVEGEPRDQDEHGKPRDENSAVVPTQDKRSAEPETNGHRHQKANLSTASVGLIVDGNIGRRAPKPDVVEGPWTHDLHGAVARDDRPAYPARPSPYSPRPHDNTPRLVTMAPRSSPPNRSFSTTVLVGSVPVVVFLPGMQQPKTFPAMPKRHYTRLPQHRPPLRRDKPVRVSIPGHPPRYILPAPERSFIFIPRAMRPNQRGFRGRGRGGFYPSPRSTFFPGPPYSQSVPMSRRSSLRDGVPSPAGSVLSRHTVTDHSKPLVRLPPANRPPVPSYPPSASTAPSAPPGSTAANYPPTSGVAFRESRGGSIPMHQPRPQKAVSVADIEGPSSFSYNPPPPPPEQPFQYQMPAPAPVPVSGSGYEQGAFPHSRHPSQQTASTPVSHLPERAVYASPFQPYSYPAPVAYMPPGQPPGAVLYPTPPADYSPYGAAPPMPHPGPPPMPYGMAPPPPGTGDPSASGTIAHESNGTVYYYDSSQYYQNGGYGMMPSPGTTYYYGQPPGMYYP